MRLPCGAATPTMTIVPEIRSNKSLLSNNIES
jgi:hypothetical protein